MAIGLGRSMSHPSFIFLEIIYAVSLFFVVLGIARLLLGIFNVYVTLMFFSGYYYENMKSFIMYNIFHCLHISLRSLFEAPVYHKTTVDNVLATEYQENSKLMFFWMHLITALILFYPLALQLQRRKLVLDFVLTIYAVYVLFATLILRHLIFNAYWWWSVLTSFVTLFAFSYYTCLQMELETVSLSGSSNNNNAANNNTNNTNNANNDNSANSDVNINFPYNFSSTKICELSRRGANVIRNLLPKYNARIRERVSRES